jgi:uncharacterized phage protein gp47/JayE
MINIPTLKSLYDDILLNLEAEFGSNIPRFGKAFLRALAAVQAAKLKLIYLRIAVLQKNIFADTADPGSKGGTLERFGIMKLGRDMFPAVAGQYDVTITGTIGATIDAQTTFKANDDSSNPGKMFILDTPHTMATISETIRLRALEAGTDSQLSIGDELTSTSPIIGINKTATVNSEYIAPLAAEEVEDYREKVVQAYQLEPNGGAVGDFRIWASDAQGVARVYPYPKSGSPGEINLFVEATAADSTDGFGTPTADILDTVAEVIELDPDTTKTIDERGRRPMLMIVNCLAVSIKSITITIAGFQDLTAAKQTAILNSMISRIGDIRPFITGADALEDKDDILNTNIIISQILSVSPGAIFGAVKLYVDGVELSTNTFQNGDIPNLVSITYL